MNLGLNTVNPKGSQMERTMAKFIELKQVCKVFRRVQGEDETEYIHEPIIVNVDLIRTIIPQGESCIINFAGEAESIVVSHSYLLVMGLINGHQ